MNLFLSLNDKFFTKLDPINLVDFIKENDKDNLVKGLELNIKYDMDKKYFADLINYSNQKDFFINLHSPNYTNIEQYKKYLKFAKDISIVQNRKINITIHPCDSTSIELSKIKSEEMINLIMSYIYENNLEKYFDISLENLNSVEGYYRLTKPDVLNLLNINNNIKFTYDIGHEFADGANKVKIPKIIYNRISNIHIHTYIDKKDHLPITNYNDCKFVKETLLSLLKKGYNKAIVLEYAIEYMNGNSFEEKFKAYINSFKIINNI